METLSFEYGYASIGFSFKFSFTKLMFSTGINFAIAATETFFLTFSFILQILIFFFLYFFSEIPW